MVEGVASESSGSPSVAQDAMLRLLSCQSMAPRGGDLGGFWSFLGPRVACVCSGLLLCPGTAGKSSGGPALQSGAWGTQGANR